MSESESESESERESERGRESARERVEGEIRKKSTEHEMQSAMSQKPQMTLAMLNKQEGMEGRQVGYKRISRPRDSRCIPNATLFPI